MTMERFDYDPCPYVLLDEHPDWLVRFMSKQEYQKFIDGEQLFNDIDWNNEGFQTMSKGFCFFGVKLNGETLEEHIKRLASFTSGIVNQEMVLCIKPSGGFQLRLLSSNARYAKDDYSMTEEDKLEDLKIAKKVLKGEITMEEYVAKTKAYQIIREYFVKDYSRNDASVIAYCQLPPIDNPYVALACGKPVFDREVSIKLLTEELDEYQ